jgi:hypothetical protein
MILILHTSADLVPEFDPDATNNCDFQWSEGIEKFNGMAEDDLWAILGLLDKRIPFFNICKIQRMVNPLLYTGTSLLAL